MTVSSCLRFSFGLPKFASVQARSNFRPEEYSTKKETKLFNFLFFRGDYVYTIVIYYFDAAGLSDNYFYERTRVPILSARLYKKPSKINNYVE